MDRNNNSETKEISNDEIIVYLDSHSRNNNGLWDLFIDFRTKKDLEIFKQVTGLRFDDSASYLKLLSVKTNKYLKVNCYYKLNVEKFKNIKSFRDTESYVIAGSYDFSEMARPKSENDEILQSHLRLESIDKTNNNRLNFLSKRDLIPNDLLNPLLYIANVGQANWNELRDNGNPVIVFDCGAPIEALKYEVDSIWSKHEILLQKMKPTLIISHWDVDHYHCLKRLSLLDIKKCFSSVFCVNKTMSKTSIETLRLLRSALGEKNVIALNPPTKSNKRSSQMVKTKFYFVKTPFFCLVIYGGR